MSSGIYELSGYSQCNLSSFAHFISDDKVCDNTFDSMDRSDEDGHCIHVNGVVLDPLYVSPKVSTFEECTLFASGRSNKTGVVVSGTCRE